MSRTHQDQQVFLTYDMDLRRDVQNVRPVTTYFGSATGCNTFKLAHRRLRHPRCAEHLRHHGQGRGVLLGAGGHIHNGGSYADLSDDRDRRLCRSELTLGTDTVGMGDMMSGPDQPPEFYDDDRTIAGISTCALNEAVKAGERLRFDAAYENERARTGVMGIYTAYVWEGGGPATPAGPGGPAIPASPVVPVGPVVPARPAVPAGAGSDRTPLGATSRVAAAAGARPVSGRPSYTG